VGKAQPSQRKRLEDEAAKWKRQKRAEPCVDILRFIPSVGRCAAVQREEVKREAEGAEVKQERRPVPPEPAAMLSRLRTEAVKAEEAAVSADAHVVVARRRLDRIQEQKGKLQELRLLLSSSSHIELDDDEGYERFLSERAVVDAQYEEVAASCIRLAHEWAEADAAFYEAKDAASFAREDVADEEREQARRRLALLTAQVQVSMEREEQIRAQIAEVEMEERVENKPMRERILAQAEEVWGPDHATRPRRAVFDMR
jgi:hypothetical protein